MKPEMVPPRVGATSRGEVSRSATGALRAWRDITLKRWAWTTAIALILLLAYWVGVLPVLLDAVPSLIGQPFRDSSTVGFVGAAAIFLAAAYCFLLTVSIAECGDPQRQTAVRRYVVAGLAACGAAVLIEIALYVLVPSTSPSMGGVALLSNTRQLLGRAAWSVPNYGLSGGLALAVYVRFRSARLAREAFNTAELERVAASREVLASRLAAMQARIEPQFLLSTLAQVEALYEHDPQAGDRMLDGLIAYLHAALPQLRGTRSTVDQEAQLAASYLRVMQVRMGSRLAYNVDVHPELGDRDFPPMVLLPLVDDALRNGLEPSPHGGTIAIAADAVGGRVRVRIVDDGMPRMATAKQSAAIATLRERLRGLYGTSAGFELAANTPQGVIATVEVPLAAARNHR